MGWNYLSILKIWEWMINFIPHFTGHVIAHPCWDRKFINDNKRGPWWWERSKLKKIIVFWYVPGHQLPPFMSMAIYITSVYFKAGHTLYPKFLSKSQISFLYPSHCDRSMFWTALKNALPNLQPLLLVFRNEFFCIPQVFLPAWQHYLMPLVARG